MTTEKNYYCETCNETVRGDEEMSAHSYTTGHKYYCNKEQVDTGFYRIDDRRSIEDILGINNEKKL